MNQPKAQFTKREIVVLKELAKDGFKRTSLQKAGEAAGFTPLQAGQAAANALRKLGKNGEMKQALLEQGVDLPYLAGKLRELLECDNEKGTPDNFIRHRAWESAIKVLDLEPAKKLEIDEHKRVEIVISDDTVRRIQKADAEIIDAEAAD